MEKSGKELYYILSDIHLGTNDRVNWYQKDFHGTYLSEVLSYITQQKGVVDVIFNGDWFDNWVNRSQSKVENPKFMVEKILSAHTNLFSESGNCGNFISLNKSIAGNLCYVHGNHDMEIKTEYINEFLNLNKPIMNCDTHYAKNEIYAEHGHLYTTLNRPFTKKENKYNPLPLGYFITRIAADLSYKQLNESQTAADLEDNGVSIWNLIKEHKWLLAKVCITKILEGYPSSFILICFLVAILSAEADINDVHGVKDYIRSQDKGYFDIILQNYKFNMPDASSINAKEAIYLYKILDISLLSDRVQCEFNQQLTKYALKLSKKHKNEHRIIALGHTHLEQNMFLDDQNKVYINSGFICPDRPNFESNKYKMTFVEIEKEQNDSIYQYIVRIKGINKDRVITTHSERKINGRF